MTKKIYPPTYFTITIIFMILLHLLLPVFHIFNDLWIFLGIIPFFSGIVFNLLADRAIKNNNTTDKPGEESEILITVGIFRLSRNPMYFGMILIHIAIGIFLGSLSPFFVIPVFIYFIDKRFIKVEEGMMKDKFGSKWIEYKKRTRKWI